MPLAKSFSGWTFLHALTYSHTRSPPPGLDHCHQHQSPLPQQHKGLLRAQAPHLQAPQLCLPSTAPPALSSLPNTPTHTSHHKRNTMTNKPANWWKGCLAMYSPTHRSPSPEFLQEDKEEGGNSLLTMPEPTQAWVKVWDALNSK